MEALLARPALPVWIDLLKSPVCAELERKYSEVLKLPVTPQGEFFKDNGPAIARFYRGEVRGLGVFGKPDDIPGVVGLVKNPYGDRIWTESDDVGVRNAVLGIDGVLYAAKAKSFGFQVIRPVAPSMQEEIGLAIQKAVECTEVDSFPVWLKI